MEDVIGGDPVKLGYLTVWAAHHLLTGYRFKRGVYRLREWGLRVSYFPRAPRVAARPAAHDHEGQPGGVPRVASSRYATAAGAGAAGSAAPARPRQWISTQAT